MVRDSVEHTHATPRSDENNFTQRVLVCSYVRAHTAMPLDDATTTTAAAATTEAQTDGAHLLLLLLRAATEPQRADASTARVCAQKLNNRAVDDYDDV